MRRARAAGQRIEQRARIAVLRVFKHGATVPRSTISRDASPRRRRHLRHDAKIVGDQQHGAADLALQRSYQPEKLRLQRDVDGGRRPRPRSAPPAQTSASRHDALGAPGKLVRVCS